MSDVQDKLTFRPDRILAALDRVLGADAIVSLEFRYDPPPAHTDEDDYLRIQCLLSQPPVYRAFGISTLKLRFPFRKTRGFEVVGSLANLLAEPGPHFDFILSAEIAFSESKAFFDLLLAHDYSHVEAYVIDVPWCEWFAGDGVFDKTLLVGRGDAWWVLAITSTD
jgi:hypothetical protein